MSDDCPTYVLELRALPDDDPLEIRLRAALKLLKRRYALECRHVEEVTPEAEEEEEGHE